MDLPLPPPVTTAMRPLTEKSSDAWKEDMFGDFGRIDFDLNKFDLLYRCTLKDESLERR